MSSANEVFDRLESAIDAWNAEMSGVYERLAGRIDQARARVHDHSAERQLIEETGDVLATCRTQLDEVKAAAEACMQAAREALERVEAVQTDLAALRTAVQEWRSEPSAPAGVTEERLEDLKLDILTHIPAMPESHADDIIELRLTMDTLREEVNRLSEMPTPTATLDPSQIDAIKAELAAAIPVADNSENDLEALREELQSLRDSVDPGMSEGSEMFHKELADLRAAMEDQMRELRSAMAMAPAPLEPDGVRELARELAQLRVDLERMKAAPASRPNFDDIPEDDTDFDLEPLADRESLEDRTIQAQWPDGTRKRLGEILLGAGLISSEQMDAALAVQKQEPQKRLGAILVDMKYANADEIAEVLSHQLNVRFVRLEIEPPTEEAAGLVSPRLARHHHCMPLSCTNEDLILAMANPLDLIAIEDVELAAKRRVEPVIASTDAITRALDLYYPPTAG